MEEQYNFKDAEIDQKTNSFSVPILDSARTLALSRTNNKLNKKQKVPSVVPSNGKQRTALTEKALLTNHFQKNAQGNFTVDYKNWTQAQFSGTSITTKSEKDKNKKEQKLKQLQAQVDTRLMAECTFKPQTNKSKIKRNLNQFLESQSNYTKKIQEKRQNLKKTLTKSLQQTQKSKPTINSNANNKKGTVPIHDRLYNLRQKQQIVETEVTESFKPAIHKKSQNMVRNMPVGQLLYQDALRRTNTQKQALNSAIQKESRLRVVNKSSKNDKFAAQKFIKEYYYCLEQLNLDQWKEELSEEMYIDVLKNLGFLGSEQLWIEGENPMTQEQSQLVAESYAILREFGVDARNVCVFLLGLLGIYNINPVNFNRIKEPETEDDEFNLDEIQGRKVQKYFIRLFHNRLSSEALKKTSFIDENTYQPTTNVESNDMAQRYRQRMIQLANEVMANNDVQLILPQDGSISHTDLLVIHKLAKQMELQKKRTQKNNIYDPECTFKPKTEKSQAGTPRYHYFDTQAGMQKSHELYNQAKLKNSSITTPKVIAQSNSKDPKNPKQKVNKTMKGQSQAKCIKNNDNPNKKPIKNTNQQSPFFAKDVDKTLARMYEGRKQREQLKKLLQRGQTKNSKSGVRSQKQSIMDHRPSTQKSEKQLLAHLSLHQMAHPLSRQTPKDKDLLESNADQMNFDMPEEPLLVIDVNMGDEKEQIQVYHGDQNRLAQIVDYFCEKHDLDSESKDQLMEMVDAEVAEVLRSLQKYN